MTLNNVLALPSSSPVHRAFVRLVLAASVLVSMPVAAEPDRATSTVAYGITTLELSTAGVFGLAFGTQYKMEGPRMLIATAPLVLAGAAGYGAYALDADPRPALAVHGAGWLGLDLFMLGSLIEGRDKAFGLRAGPLAWTLGGIGAVAGGLVGWFGPDGSRETAAWLSAPAGGFLAGGLVLGGVLVLAGGLDGDKAPGQFTTGALAGLTIGLGAATYFVLRDRAEAPGGTTAHVTPLVEGGPRRFMLSFGGAF